LPTDGNDFSFLLNITVGVASFSLKHLQRKSSRNGKKHFCSSFVKQRFCNGITTLSKRYRNGPLAMKRFRNGETIHLQRNDSLQRIEIGFREKHFENYFDMVLQWYSNGIVTASSVRNYIFVSGFEGKCLCNDNFCFTEKRIPFCQETIIVSIGLQRLCNDLIWRNSLSSPCIH
jgi:hypothetical protein